MTRDLINTNDPVARHNARMAAQRRQDDGRTPKRPRPMPNRDAYTKAHAATHRDPDGAPVTQTYPTTEAK
jgi:hypothetical protein